MTTTETSLTLCHNGKIPLGFDRRKKNDALVLHIIAPIGQTLTKEVYAVFHGRFIEMVLAHFDELTTEAVATAVAEDDDVITA